jgi:hypothetical protein
MFIEEPENDVIGFARFWNLGEEIEGMTHALPDVEVCFHSESHLLTKKFRRPAMLQPSGSGEQKPRLAVRCGFLLREAPRIQAHLSWLGSNPIFGKKPTLTKPPVKKRYPLVTAFSLGSYSEAVTSGSEHVKFRRNVRLLPGTVSGQVPIDAAADGIERVIRRGYDKDWWS